jgi:hypothetical protein
MNKLQCELNFIFVKDFSLFIYININERQNIIKTDR